MNDDKKLINYFKKWEGTNALGIGILAVAFLLIWINVSYYLFTLGILLIVPGALIFLYGNIGRGHESQIYDRIEDNVETIRFDELEEDFKLHRRTPKDPEELVFEGFEFREGLYIKKKNDGTLLSSEYTYVKIVVLKDAFYTKVMTVPLITQEKTLTTHDIPFSSITDMRVLREEKMISRGKKEKIKAKTCRICITYGENQQLLLPIKDDAYVEEHVEDMKKKYGILQ